MTLIFDCMVLVLVGAVMTWPIIGLVGFDVIRCVSLFVLLDCAMIFDGNVMDNMFTLDESIESEILVFLWACDIGFERTYLMGGNKYLVFLLINL